MNLLMMGSARLTGRPKRRDAGDVLRIALDRGIRDVEPTVGWTERDLELDLPVVVVDDRLSPEDRVERGQSLLPIDDETTGRMGLGIEPDGLRAIDVGVLPEEQIADREAAVHRVEQVADFGGVPDERPLNIGQTDVTELDVCQQRGDVVVDLLEDRLLLAHARSPPLPVRPAGFTSRL